MMVRQVREELPDDIYFLGILWVLLKLLLYFHNLLVFWVMQFYWFSDFPLITVAIRVRINSGVQIPASYTVSKTAPRLGYI